LTVCGILKKKTAEKETPCKWGECISWGNNLYTSKVPKRRRTASQQGKGQGKGGEGLFSLCLKGAKDKTKRKNT